MFFPLPFPFSLRVLSFFGKIHLDVRCVYTYVYTRARAQACNCVCVCVRVCVCSCSLSDRMLICWYRSSIVVVIIVVSFHRVFTFTFLSRIARAFSTGFFADARYVPWFCTCTRSFVSRRATNLHYTTYGHVELRQVKNVCYDCVEYKASKKKWNIANKSKLM